MHYMHAKSIGEDIFKKIQTLMPIGPLRLQDWTPAHFLNIAFTKLNLFIGNPKL